MMLAGFFFLCLFSGGTSYNISEQTELQEDRLNSNYDNDEDGSTNQSSKYPELQQRNNRNQNDSTTIINQQSQNVKNQNKICTHRDVYESLKLTTDNLNSKIRPTFSSPYTLVKLEMLLYGILGVNEKQQQFASHIWIFSRWYEPDVNWHPQDFCGISTIYPPSDVFWTPDLTIEEMINEDRIRKSPYLLLDFDGEVFLRSNMVVVTTCKMEIYKFPFDVQSCKLSFKSIVHSIEDLRIINAADSKWNMDWSREKMTQSEWLFVNLNISEELVDNFGIEQTVVVYTITMKRRSALYIANFLLPIMFFLCLDLASFLISDSGGEKLGFKVTVMLAVTVMQLVLNDILPASTDRIPLVAVYIIGIFGFMMLSLLETIVMMYLLGKDAAAKGNGADEEQSQNFKKRTADESPPEQMEVDKEGDSSKPTHEPIALKDISDELKDVEKMLTRVLDGRTDENEPGYWTKVAETVNIVFIVFYVIGVIAFLIYLFFMWTEPDDE